jgi:hypothetical protein
MLSFIHTFPPASARVYSIFHFHKCVLLAICFYLLLFAAGVSVSFCNSVLVNLNLVLRYCKKNDIHNIGFIVSFTIALFWLSTSVDDTS